MPTISTAFSQNMLFYYNLPALTHIRVSQFTPTWQKLPKSPCANHWTHYASSFGLLVIICSKNWTPNTAAMNVTCCGLSPLFTPCTYPFLIMFITSYPCNVLHAVSKEKKPMPGLTSRLMNRWSCSIRLFKYFTCRSSTESGRIPLAFSSAMTFG